MGNEIMPTGKPKSFWAKPEGTTGMLVAIFGGAFVLYNALPFVIRMLQDTLHALMLGGILALALYIIFDPKWRALGWYFYQSVMRAITGVFITVDPIGIIKNYIKSMKENLAKMQAQMGNLNGQIVSIKKLMANNEAQAVNSIKLAAQAQKMERQADVLLQTRNAARLRESNKNLGGLTVKLEVLLRVLDKMVGTSETVIEDTESDVAVKESEFKAMSAGSSAMRSAMSIIKGDPDKKAIFDQSMEYIADNISMQVGEIDNFMKMSEKITSNIDLQNGVFQESGLKMLEEWEQKADSGRLLSLADKKRIIAAANDPDDTVELVKKGDNPYKGILKSAGKK